jgi:hypothetical protein
MIAITFAMHYLALENIGAVNQLHVPTVSLIICFITDQALVGPDARCYVGTPGRRRLCTEQLHAAQAVLTSKIAWNLSD